MRLERERERRLNCALVGLLWWEDEDSPIWGWAANASSQPLTSTCKSKENMLRERSDSEENIVTHITHICLSIYIFTYLIHIKFYMFLTHSSRKKNCKFKIQARQGNPFLLHHAYGNECYNSLFKFGILYELVCLPYIHTYIYKYM